MTGREAGPAGSRWNAIGLVVVVLAVSNLVANRVLPGGAATVAWNIAAAVVLLAIAVRGDGRAFDQFGLGRRDAAAGVRWGAALAAVVVIGFAVALAVPGARRAFDDARGSAMLGTTLFHAFVTVPFGTVLVEEVAFRGVLPAMLRARISQRAAIGWASLLFGLWHVLPSWNVNHDNALARHVMPAAVPMPVGRFLTVCGAVLSTAAVGVCFCWLRERSRSLLTPMILHTATNSSAYLAAWWVLR